MMIKFNPNTDYIMKVDSKTSSLTIYGEASTVIERLNKMCGVSLPSEVLVGTINETDRAYEIKAVPHRLLRSMDSPDIYIGTRKTNKEEIADGMYGVNADDIEFKTITHGFIFRTKENVAIVKNRTMVLYRTDDDYRSYRLPKAITSVEYRH